MTAEMDSCHCAGDKRSMRVAVCSATTYNRSYKVEYVIKGE